MIALKNNTVYMQSPSLFDDVYDSEINIDYYDYHKYRLLEYFRRCGLPVDESKTIENIGIELLKAIQESVEKNKDLHWTLQKPCHESLNKIWLFMIVRMILDILCRLSWDKKIVDA